MSLFNKVNKGIDKNKQKEVTERLNSLYEVVAGYLQDNKANFYEVMDILSQLQVDLNFKIADLLRSNHAKIQDLQDKLVRYDLNKPTESSGEENKQ